jgi:hypothetical protein
MCRSCTIRCKSCSEMMCPECADFCTSCDVEGRNRFALCGECAINMGEDQCCNRCKDMLCEGCASCVDGWRGSLCLKCVRGVTSDVEVEERGHSKKRKRAQVASAKKKVSKVGRSAAEGVAAAAF